MLPLALLPMLGAAFDPSRLAGQVLWNRSDRGVLTTAGVMTSWADSLGNTFIPVNATGPTYLASDPAFNGLPSLNVATTANVIKTNANVTYGPFTSFFCAQIPTQVAAGDLYAHFNGAIADSLAMPITNGGLSTAITRVKNAANVTFTKTAPARWAESASCEIITVRFDGTKVGSSVRVNGTVLAESGGSFTNDPGLAPLSAPIYLFSVNGAAQLTTGKIAELAIYNRFLADAEVLDFESYMKSRYAIP